LDELPTSSKSNISRNGYVYTFYSYKGGVGRSMAVANVGVLMALAGHRVLLIDWDLEAPGLEVYFEKSATLMGAPKSTPGIVDMIESHAVSKKLDWEDCLLSAKFPGGSLDIITSGMKNSDYRQRVQSLDWDVLFDQHQIGNYFDDLRSAWCSCYDFVLIDSRTGITDIGDICTVLLPDVLVLMFVSNYQNINGIRSVIDRAIRARGKLPINRSALLGLPLPARDEVYTEYEQSKEWKELYANELGELYSRWLPKEIEPIDALNKLFIPYVTNWSFGERIPVLENKYELSDPTSISAAYSRISTLLSSRLDWYALENRSSATEIQGTRIELERARDSIKEAQEKQGKSTRAIKWVSGILLTLIVSIGILAAISIPAYQDYTIRAKVAEGLAYSSVAKVAVAEYFAERGKVPNSSKEAGIDELNNIFNEGTVKIQNGGIIQILFNNEIEEVGLKSIFIYPEVKSDELVWSCFSKEVDSRYLPSGCK